MKSKKVKSLENNINLDVLINILPYLHIFDRINLKQSSTYYLEFFKKNPLYKPIHLIYIMDVTASMIMYIESFYKKVSKLNTYLDKLNTTYSIIEFMDHENNVFSDSDNEYDSTNFITRVHPNLKSSKICNKILNKLNIDNGGDIPEAIADAFYEVNNLKCNKNYTNIVIFCSDAFPHGENYDEDSFPNGCPCGLDYKNELSKFEENNIKFIYYSLNLNNTLYIEYINKFKLNIKNLVNYIELSEYNEIKKYILNYI